MATETTTHAQRPTRRRILASITRSLAVRSALTIGIMSAYASVWPAGIAAARDTPRARFAHTLNVTDTARLHYIKELGSTLLDEGSATGALPGKVSVRFNVGASVAATFTIYAKGGAIVGHGSGVLHGTGVTVSFGGTMTVSHGTGRYAHAHGHGGFYGVINRKNYAATVQTTGTLTY
jgi:hypothetical protein